MNWPPKTIVVHEQIHHDGSDRLSANDAAAHSGSELIRNVQDIRACCPIAEILFAGVVAQRPPLRNCQKYKKKNILTIIYFYLLYVLEQHPLHYRASIWPKRCPVFLPSWWLHTVFNNLTAA